ncbi:hypothetical protein OG874_24980 [Nocardia sp. NBC_00565]|nr:hypothetical protein [Nocardia sp. NBC_00565]WUC00156.1 hypothetical protein OG874_24980 [Nocardia sp. NBC_00565]
MTEVIDEEETTDVSVRAGPIGTAVAFGGADALTSATATMP